MCSKFRNPPPSRFRSFVLRFKDSIGPLERLLLYIPSGPSLSTIMNELIMGFLYLRSKFQNSTNIWYLLLQYLCIRESISSAAFKGLPAFLELNLTYSSFKSLKTLIYGWRARNFSSYPKVYMKYLKCLSYLGSKWYFKCYWFLRSNHRYFLRRYTSSEIGVLCWCPYFEKFAHRLDSSRTLYSIL